MFEKLTRHAEQFATDVGHSRRGFLGRAGRGALAAAGALGILLAAPRKAQAGRPGGVKQCIRDCIATGGDYSTCYFICEGIGG
jgi:hypothetical protein